MWSHARYMHTYIHTSQERCWKLLEAIPPQGAQFVATLRKIMDRENNWANWKKEKCPDFAKVCVHVYVCLCVCVCVCVCVHGGIHARL